jgi:hypothetical protein
MNFNMEFRHDNIHFTLPNGTAFSLVRINNKHEVAVLDGDKFIPVTEWYGAGGIWSTNEDVLSINAQASTLHRVLGTAIAWGEGDKNRVIAEALDQAL